MAWLANLLCVAALHVFVVCVRAQEDDTLALVEYTRELLETLKKQVEWAKMTTDQLGTMMGPRLGTHFTPLGGYCASGVSVTSHWNITTIDCLYECLSADDCAGFNFYVFADRPATYRCEMVTVSLFSAIVAQAECTMFVRVRFLIAGTFHGFTLL